jgi:hypothetical protein
MGISGREPEKSTRGEARKHPASVPPFHLEGYPAASPLTETPGEYKPLIRMISAALSYRYGLYEDTLVRLSHHAKSS